MAIIRAVTNGHKKKDVTALTDSLLRNENLDMQLTVPIDVRCKLPFYLHSNKKRPFPILIYISQRFTSYLALRCLPAVPFASEAWVFAYMWENRIVLHVPTVYNLSLFATFGCY